MTEKDIFKMLGKGDLLIDQALTIKEFSNPCTKIEFVDAMKFDNSGDFERIKDDKDN
jgi:hypothetical protein